MKTLANRIFERLVMSGDYGPGVLNLSADIVELAAIEAKTWTNRCDDAMRIPDMLSDAADKLRKDAKDIAERMP